MFNTVSDVMNEKVLTVRSNTDIHTLARFLTEKRISGVPVVDHDDKLVGVVSMFDLVERQGRVGDTETAAYWGGDPHLPAGFSIEDLSKSSVTVEDVMTPAIYSVDPRADLISLCDFFMAGDLHRVLVTEHGRLVGIVTPKDLLRVLRYGLVCPATVPDVRGEGFRGLS